MKITACSSDIRKTLQVIREAVRRCHDQGVPRVTCTHVEEAYAEVYSNPLTTALAMLPPALKLILTQLRRQLEVLERTEGPALDLYCRVQPLAPHPPSYEVFLRMLHQLEQMGILALKHRLKLREEYRVKGPPLPSKQVHLIVSFKVAEDWVSNALSDLGHPR